MRVLNKDFYRSCIFCDYKFECRPFFNIYYSGCDCQCSFLIYSSFNEIVRIKIKLCDELEYNFISRPKSIVVFSNQKRKIFFNQHKLEVFKEDLFEKLQKYKSLI